MQEVSTEEPDANVLGAPSRAPDSALIPMPPTTVPAVVRWGAALIIKLLGWQIVGNTRLASKYVVIAQHTSNWDAVYSLSAGLAQGTMPHWLGKSELFSGLKGRFMRWLGGLPVERSRAANTVDQVVAMFAERESLMLFVAPSGTRGKAKRWKTGFYYIALGARVPIALGILDYGRKQVGLGPMLWPSGDIQADMVIIRDYFAAQRARHPDSETPIRLEEEDQAA